MCGAYGRDGNPLTIDEKVPRHEFGLWITPAGRTPPPRAETTTMPARRVFGLLTAVILIGAGLMPASAGGPQTSTGAPTRHGLAKNVQLVSHESFGNRGNNSPIAVAGPCVYVGDRGDSGGIAIVDASRPATLHTVGFIKPTSGSTQRELRADRGLGILVVMTYSLRGIGDTAGNYLKTYDIRDCRHPKLLSTVDFGARSPHEFFLWKDPKHPGRALAYVTFTLFTPDLMVYDLTNPAAPSLAAVYDVVVDQTSKAADAAASGSGYLHSISVSDDGTRAYMGNWDYGFYVADTSLLANPPLAGLGIVRPVGIGRLDYGHNVHGAVKVPGRPYVVMVQEEYANAGHGCPFGWLRMASIADENAPKSLGEFKIPENDCARAKALNGTFTAHNQTLFPDLALVPWYSGGLRIVDISDPNRPHEAGAFVPDNAPDPNHRDSRLYFPGASADRWTGALWSYPVVQDGLIYVVDIDQGLFVLRYTGPRASEVSSASFVEGNSAPSRYSKSAKAILRPASSWAIVDHAEASQPRTFAVPLAAPRIKRGTKTYGFICS